MDALTKEKWLRVADLVENDGKDFTFRDEECIKPRAEEIFGRAELSRHRRGEYEMEIRKLFFTWPRWMIKRPDRIIAARVITKFATEGLVEWPE